MMEVDEALSRLGKFGRWQMFTYSLLCLSVTWPGCWHMMVTVFTGGTPKHHCFVPDGANISEYIPLVYKKGKSQYAECKRYRNLTIDNSTVPCDQGWYYAPEYDSTIVTDWDLVCDKNYLSETSQSVFNFGVMLGAVAFTSIADRIGRKPVHLGSQWAMALVGVVLAFSPDFISYTVLRFIQGAVREGAGLTGIVMACELFPADQRTFAGAALELFWAAGWMVLAGIAYFIRDWRWLQLTISLPALLTIAFVWIIPESVPWLAANDRVKKAEKILTRAAKVNRVNFPQNALSPSTEEASKRLLDNNTDQQTSPDPSKVTTPVDGTDMKEVAPGGMVKTKKKHSHLQKIVQILTSQKDGLKTSDEEQIGHYSLIDVAKSRTMLLNGSIMCILWFSTAIVYFGLSLSTSTLAGDKYLNFMLSGAVEAPAYLATVFVLQKFGRRWPLLVVHVIAGASLFGVIFIPDEGGPGPDLTPLIITLTMIGKFCMTFSFGTAVLYAPEIYPTNIRNLGFGMASFAGRIGGMIAPFTAYIAKTSPWVSGLIYTILAVLSGILVLLLPETLNRPLPQTIEEIEKWTRSAPKKPPKHNGHLVVRDQNSKPSKDETSL